MIGDGMDGGLESLEDEIKKKVCEKCEKAEGTECVYYHEHEGYLCKPCYKTWLKIVRVIEKNGWSTKCKPLEKRYLQWIGEK